ncbi:hypothetical protein Tco_0975847 [Tanacetum coccineum]|uniref:Uncharacterized protein n=1 Tax=Tanacetum coccineum TaxID=301880 RepID=A0ABQ5EFK3_9ASTR
MSSTSDITFPQRAYKVDDETEANIVWKEILARKGLPLDTPYEYKNPEAAKAWSSTLTFEWLPAPNYNLPKVSSSSSGDSVTRLLYKKPEMKKFKSVNHIVYADAESKAKMNKCC